MTSKMRTLHPVTPDQIVLADSRDWSKLLTKKALDASAPSIFIRLALPKDVDFLFNLYVQVHPDLTDRQNLGEPIEKSAAWAYFLHYNQELRTQFPDLDFHVVLLEGKRAGQLIVNRQQREIFIVDIALLPNCATDEIQEYLLRDLLTEATLAHKSVKASVHSTSPLVDCYQQLGFTLTGSMNGRYLMRWSPKQPPTNLSLEENMGKA